ncbi:MAG TPA: AraC family transcriptional regulator [Terriglobia bacterium]|nr:AraC family transcriptional regulator [Terriglobia bacterium]
MSASREPTQYVQLVDEGAWIHGEMVTPVTGVSGPLIIGSGWMLEMIRPDHGERTLGLFLAPFGIVTFDIPEFSAAGRVRFVGLSSYGPPPPWLQTSMLFDMKQTQLPGSPAELLRLFEHPLHGNSAEVASNVSMLSRKAKGRICDTYRESIPISAIAQELGVSHAHLTRQFKRDFGFTPVDYRHRLRVSEATGRLFKGDDILDVGHDVGFNDTSRFYKDFRKITGTSPGKCRL